MVVYEGTMKDGDDENKQAVVQHRTIHLQKKDENKTRFLDCEVKLLSKQVKMIGSYKGYRHDYNIPTTALLIIPLNKNLHFVDYFNKVPLY